MTEDTRHLIDENRTELQALADSNLPAAPLAEAVLGLSAE